MLTRRRFLKAMAAVGGAVMVPSRWLGRAQAIAFAEGELYEGFLLLADDEAPVPNFVQRARGIDLHGRDASLSGESVQFHSIEELRNYVSFPIYVPAALPSDLQFVNATVIRYTLSSQIWAAIVSYGVYRADIGAQEPRISLWARREYSRPYPVRPVHSPFSETSDLVHPEKVGFSPSPGVMLPNVRGHVVHWIQQDTLYTLEVEHDPAREAAVTMAASLVQT